MKRFGSGNKFVDALVDTFGKTQNPKLKSGIVSTLSARAEGQESVIALLSQCVENHETEETPLVLTCLSGLQQQAKKDSRAWAAVEKSIQSEDPDVLYATLDVISALPETQNEKITARLVKLIQEVDDEDTQEKAVLSLGVCGTHDEISVEVLKGLVEKKDTPDGVRIASALVLGKQGNLFPEKPKMVLSKCYKEEKSQSLRTACQLGLQEIDSRTISSTGTPTPKK